MKQTVTSTPTNDPHVTLELIDQTAPKPSGKNRSRAEQRHHRERMKQNRVNQIRESEPGVDLAAEFNPRWLNGLDDHPVSKQSEQTTKHNQVNKFSHKQRQYELDWDDLDDDGGYYSGTDY